MQVHFVFVCLRVAVFTFGSVFEFAGWLCHNLQ
jgi:hypothetical protein